MACWRLGPPIVGLIRNRGPAVAPSLKIVMGKYNPLVRSRLGFG